MILRQWTRIPVVVAVLLVAAVVGLRQSAGVHAQSRWGADYFPNVPLTTHNGDVVHFYDLIKGKIVAIELMYTSCEFSCPLETARLAQVQRLLGERMGRDVFFYSISIDPAHDTAEVLKGYAEHYGAGPNWLFLTGKAKDIEQLSKKLGLYSEPNPENKDGHTPTLLIGNEATGQWMRGSALDNPQFTA
jgi:protein SCO1/2